MTTKKKKKNDKIVIPNCNPKKLKTNEPIRLT